MYDELVRRQRSAGRNASPTSQTEFLPVKPEFHPKRNQARQKLATLPKVRFRDLASDVYFELERRYPEFRESEIPEPQAYQPSASQRRPQFTNQHSAASGAGSVANEVIIPNKSTLVEEDVGMPPSSSTNSIAGPSLQQSGLGRSRGYSGSSENANQIQIPAPRRSGERDRAPSPSNYDRDQISPTSLNGARKSNDIPRTNVTQPSSPDWAPHSMARASEASSIGTRLVGAYGASSSRSDAGGDWEREQHTEELEKLRSDYEFRIATTQNRIQGLERDLENSRTRTDERVRTLENQLDKMESRHEDALQNVQQLERDLAEAQDRHTAIPPYSENTTDKEEIAQLRSELAAAERRAGGRSDVEGNLKREMEGLLDTLREMNVRQDELASEREADGARIEELLAEVQDWKKRYESAKTELRNLKATSQLFVKPTKPDDDYMPTSAEGGIIDAHVTSFQASIDDLLIGGRSNAPSSVIIATKQVINAVARIDEDVQEYERSGRAEHLPEEDRDRLHALKSKCNATLSNLTTAARTHATGHGLSPVSLLDAAASHLSVTVIELVRLLHLRKAGTALPPLVNGTSRHAQSDSSLSRHTQQAASQSSIASKSSAQQPASRAGPTNPYPARSGSLRPLDQQQAQPNGRLSPAPSFRSRIETASPDPDRSQTPQDSQRGMPASTSNGSLASSLHHGSAYPSRQQSLNDAVRGESPQPPPIAEERPDYAEDGDEDHRGQRAETETADWNELKVSRAGDHSVRVLTFVCRTTSRPRLKP